MLAAAQLHSIDVSPDALPVWDYEGELAAAAGETLEYVEAHSRNAVLGIDSASARAVRASSERFHWSAVRSVPVHSPRR